MCDVVSYADISLFEGEIYDFLGFEKVNLSDPNYFWVVNKKRRHRYNFSKRKFPLTTNIDTLLRIFPNNFLFLFKMHFSN